VSELSGYQGRSNDELRELTPEYRKLVGEFIGETNAGMEHSSFFGATLITPSIRAVTVPKPTEIPSSEFLNMRQIIFPGPLSLYEGMVSEHQPYLDDPDYFLHSSPKGEPVNRLKQKGKYTNIQLRLHPNKIQDMLLLVRNELLALSKSIRISENSNVPRSAGEITNEIITLKPNFFGIGIDVNAVIERIHQWRSSKG